MLGLCISAVAALRSFVVSVQRLPLEFQALLQRFEGWLLQKFKQQPGLLERIQLSLYRASPAPLLEELQREVAEQLSKELSAMEEPLPYVLLRELQNGGFWRQYVCTWLLALEPALVALLPPGPVAVRGDVTANSMPTIQLDAYIFSLENHVT